MSSAPQAEECILVLTTYPASAPVQKIAQDLVEQQLAACVNRIPVHSTYRWQGAVEEEAEVLLLIKTVRTHQEALREALLKTHPYEVPEFLVLPISAGSEKYLQWLGDSV